jgi:hypothetical protein
MIKVWLEWPLEPIDFFLEPFTFNINGRKGVIEFGKVTVELEKNDFDDNGTVYIVFLESLDLQVKSCINLLQFKTDIKFNLKKYSLHSILKEGNLTTTIYPEPIRLNISSGEPDLIITNNIGVEVLNSNLAKLEDLSNCMTLFNTKGITDDIMVSILNSYDRSLSNPNISLMGLYEIRDALVSKFKNETRARTELGISKKAWQRFGIIANELPLLQSRHLGKKINESRRNITPEELTEIRAISTQMIEKYLLFLNKSSF